MIILIAIGIACYMLRMSHQSNQRLNHISVHVSGSKMNPRYPKVILHLGKAARCKPSSVCSLSVIPPDAEGSSLGPESNAHHADVSEMVFLTFNVWTTTTPTPKQHHQTPLQSLTHPYCGSKQKETRINNDLLTQPNKLRISKMNQCQMFSVIEMLLTPGQRDDGHR